MNNKYQIITTAFIAIIRKEVIRFMRIWVQTLLPSAITMSLYFMIFGNLIGSRIGNIHDLPYIQYIVPGLVMMSIITNSYANVVSSFFSVRFQRSIEEMLISPVPAIVVLLGFLSGGILRGIMVGAIVTLVSLLFHAAHFQHLWMIILVGILTSCLFSLAGFLNALFSKRFDDINIVPIFVLTPLTYLGGVFYSIDMLSPFWRHVTYFNPIFYMVNAFRYGFIGQSDVSLTTALSLVAAFVVTLFVLCYILLVKGIGIRT